jgi:hypothetical protein
MDNHLHSEIQKKGITLKVKTRAKPTTSRKKRENTSLAIQHWYLPFVCKCSATNAHFGDV